MRAALLLIVLASACWAWPAAAADKASPEARYKEAVELANGGRTAEALQIFLAIQETVPPALAPQVQAHLGAAFRKFGKLPEAWYHWTRHLATARKPQAGVKQEVEKLERALARDQARVEVVVDPADARIHLGTQEDAPSYPAPLTWWFAPGKHELKVTREGYRDATVVVEAGAPGSRRKELVRLDKDVRDGWLEVKGPEVGAQVFIDGMLEGTVPFRRKLKPGTYELMVGRPGRPVWKRSVEVPPGDTVVERPRLPRMMGDDEGNGSLLPTVTDTTVDERSDAGVTAVKEPEGPPSNAWKWALIGSGAGVLATGAILHLVAYSRNEDLRDKYPDGTAGNPVPAEWPDLYRQGYQDDVKPMATSAYVLYGVGGAAAVTGVVWLLLERPGEAGTTTVTPMYVPTGSGVNFSVKF